MDMTGIVLAILGSSAFTALLMAFIKRRREYAEVKRINVETDQIESAMMQNETVYYQQRVDETIKQMRVLELQVKELKAAIEVAQKQYEQRVGSLHTKIDTLTNELQRANTALETANKTIDELRQKVDDGNAVITELRKEITQLLIAQAEKK